MAVKIVSLASVPEQVMPGRSLQWVVSPQTMGTEKLAMCVLKCPVGSVARPLHAHRDTEEVIFILQGQGEAWVDGEVGAFRKGDAVFFPANSKHMIRNTGAEELLTACMFSPPTSTDSYVFYENAGGW